MSQAEEFPGVDKSARVLGDAAAARGSRMHRFQKQLRSTGPEKTSGSSARFHRMVRRNRYGCQSTRNGGVKAVEDFVGGVAKNRIPKMFTLWVLTGMVTK